MRRHFTFIEVLVAMAVFVMGVAPLLGLMAANSRQFKGDMTLFQENDVLFERMEEIRDKFRTQPAIFDNVNDDFWDPSESARYEGIYMVSLPDPIGAYGYLVTIGMGSGSEAKSALFQLDGSPVANPDPRHVSLRQHTIFLVKKGDN